MDIPRLKLQEISTQRISQCGYCLVGKSFKFWCTPLNKISIEIHDLLVDRGWVRCGDAYRFYIINYNCCYPLQLRIPLSKFQLSKKQLKLKRELIDIFGQPLILEQDIEFENRLALLKMEIVSQKQDISQKMMQQLKPQQEILQIQKLIPDDLIGIFNTFTHIIKANKIEYLSNLASFFEKKDFQFNIVMECFIIDLELDHIKIFPSNCSKKGEYYSNYMMMLYGSNKKILFSGLNMSEFVSKSKLFVNKYFIHQKYIFRLEDNGYITIINKNKMPQNTSSIQKEKEQKIQKTKKEQQQQQYQQQQQQQQSRSQSQSESQSQLYHQQKVKKQQQKQQIIHDQPIQLINQQTFQSHSFQIGNINVIVVGAEYSDEAFILYQRYSENIHFKENITSEQFIDFICLTPLKNTVIISKVDPNIQLQLGSNHMLYYLNHQLIAVGVVDVSYTTILSFYYYYEPILKEYSFGSFGTLIELEYTQIMSKYFPDLQYYTMGYFIESTPKMAYKAQILGSEVQCPITYNWMTLDDRLKAQIKINSNVLPKNRINRLSEKDLIEDLVYSNDDDLQNIQILHQDQVQKYSQLDPTQQENLKFWVEGAYRKFGKTIVNQVLFTLD